MNVDEYNRCVDLFSDGMYRFALRMMKSVEMAQDIVQDTFEKMWVKHADVDFAKAKSYLFTSTYNRAIDVIKQQKHKFDYLQQLPSEASTSETYSDLSDILNREIDQLPDIQKSVLLLRDYEGYSYEEIGQITNLNESQVKVYIYRARLFLKEKLVSVETLI